MCYKEGLILKKQHKSIPKQPQNIINLNYLEQNLGELWQEVSHRVDKIGVLKSQTLQKEKQNGMPSSACPVKKPKLKLFQVAGTGSVITNNVNFESSVASDF